MISKGKTMNTRKKEQGVVLIISLLILLVMTVIGISAISNTSMEERMSNNFQQSMVAFQSSESTIQSVFVAGDPGGAGATRNPFYATASDPLVTSLNAGLNATTTTVTKNMDPLNKLKVGLSTTATISFTGTSQLCPGYSTGINCMKFEIDTSTTLGGTKTGANHVQGLERPAPGI